MDLKPNESYYMREDLKISSLNETLLECLGKQKNWAKFDYNWNINEFKLVSMDYIKLYVICYHSYLLLIVLRPAQEFFTYMESSPLPVKGIKS
jgi:hypothetical protein